MIMSCTNKLVLMQFPVGGVKQARFSGLLVIRNVPRCIVTEENIKLQIHPLA